MYKPKNTQKESTNRLRLDIETKLPGIFTIEQQLMEADEARRKQLVWEIERMLAEDVARPIIFYERAATCWQPYVKGHTMMVNSIFNGNRREDVWLDK